MNDPDKVETFNLPFIAYVEGSYFGDSDIFFQEESSGRDGTAMADSEVQLLVLGKKDMNAIMEEFEELTKEMMQIAKERKDNHEKLIENIISEYKKAQTEEQTPKISRSYIKEELKEDKNQGKKIVEIVDATPRPLQSQEEANPKMEELSLLKPIAMHIIKDEET